MLRKKKNSDGELNDKGGRWVTFHDRTIIKREKKKERRGSKYL